MSAKNLLLKILAIAGTVLVFIPVLAPGFFSLAGLLQGGRFNYDFMAPAELFPLALAGIVLLLAAALWARKRRKFILWAIALTLFIIVGGSIAASASGLASGRTEPTPAVMVAGVVVFVALALAIALIGVGGILLTLDLFRRSPDPG